jgi:1,4-alpha-glucan branching enzyme
MPGDEWQRFANLRLLLTYQATAPGKKLSFMGNEIGQTHEWRSDEELGWHLLRWAPHQGVQTLARDLNRMCLNVSALHDQDFDAAGFSWIDCHDADQSVVGWIRYARDGRFVAVMLNFTPVPRPGYRIGLPRTGWYRELFNSDSHFYGGSDMGNGGALHAVPQAMHGEAYSLDLTLPPLATLFLRAES